MKKKPRSPLWYLLPFAILFLVLGIILYFIRPWAPLLLLASLAIQLPIILGLTKTNLSAGYRDRAFQRMRRYAEDGDAEALLAEEEREAAGVGFRYWSSGTRALSVLNRARPLIVLGRRNEAAELLAELEPRKLGSYERGQFDELVEELRSRA